MKIIFISLFVFALSSINADKVIIIPRNQQPSPPTYPQNQQPPPPTYNSYNYYPPYVPYYDYYTPYEPDNGPMRGPNSIEGHKSPRQQLRDLEYRRNY